MSATTPFQELRESTSRTDPRADSGEALRVLVCDLETTGLDLGNDLILEAAFIGVTSGLEELFRCRFLVDHPAADVADRLRGGPDVVRAMHDRSGLLGERDTGTGAVPLLQIEEYLTAKIAEFGDDTAPALGGSGVAAFDRRLIDRDLPRLSAALAYWSLDVGPMRRGFKLATGCELVSFNDTKPHRAMADAELHLAELRAFFQAFRSIPLGVRDPLQDEKTQGTTLGLPHP